jgi:hypothetical protein
MERSKPPFLLIPEKSWLLLTDVCVLQSGPSQRYGLLSSYWWLLLLLLTTAVEIQVYTSMLYAVILGLFASWLSVRFCQQGALERERLQSSVACLSLSNRLAMLILTMPPHKELNLLCRFSNTADQLPPVYLDIVINGLSPCPLDLSFSSSSHSSFQMLIIITKIYSLILNLNLHLRV